MARKYKKIEEVLKAFADLNVLVIGDVMLDQYMWGGVERISPEAPVPIVSIEKKENRLGGAANVALNVQSLGATPLLCSVIGSGPGSRTFIELMQRQKLNTDGIYLSPARQTSIKTRIIGNFHQMLRVDEEMNTEISVAERKQLLERIKIFIENKKVDVIIFEDYDKGVISKTLIQEIVKLARKHKIPVAVDPKKKNFHYYIGVDLFKPNLKELAEGMKTDLDNKNLEGIKIAVDKLSTKNKIDTILVTLSEKGAFIYSKKDETYVPAHPREISDVSGAGDTVISTAALCLALNLSQKTIATLSNLAGGLVCEKVGVVPIDAKELVAEVNGLQIF